VPDVICGWRTNRPGCARMHKATQRVLLPACPTRMWVTSECHSVLVAALLPYATYFNRRLLVTTVTLESAMAADASIGESSPSAATGIPTTL
jgi:hypothetical protein